MSFNWMNCKPWRNRSKSLVKPWQRLGVKLWATSWNCWRLGQQLEEVLWRMMMSALLLERLSMSCRHLVRCRKYPTHKLVAYQWNYWGCQWTRSRVACKWRRGRTTKRFTLLGWKTSRPSREFQVSRRLSIPPPLRLLKTSDLPDRNTKKRMSEARKLMGRLESKASELEIVIPSRPSLQEARDLCQSAIAVSTTTTAYGGVERRTRQLSLRTVGDILRWEREWMDRVFYHNSFVQVGETRA